MIFTGPTGKCVNFLERIPPDVQAKLWVGKVAADGVLRNVEQPFYYLIGRKEINIGPITSFLSVGSIWHEGGHAVEDSLFSEEDRERVKKANGVCDAVSDYLQEGKLDEIREIEESEGMDYVTARQDRAQREVFASMWGAEDMDEVKEILGIDPKLAERMGAKYEDSWQTYDQIFVPEAATSGLAATLSPEQKKVATDYLNNYRAIIDWFIKQGRGISPYEKFELAWVDGKYQVQRLISVNDGQLRSGEVSITYLPSVRGAPKISAIFGPLYGTVAYYFPDHEKMARLSIHTPQDFLENSQDAAKVVAMQELVPKILRLAIGLKEKAALGDITWLKETLRGYLKDIEELDPKARAKWLKEQIPNLDSSEDKMLVETESETAAHPLSRKAELCAHIGREIIKDLGLDNNLVYANYDPHTGKEIAGEWGRLISICREGLHKINSPEEVPDPALSADPEGTERKVIEMAAKHFAQFKNNL